jgi:hypothetical protein
MNICTKRGEEAVQKGKVGEKRKRAVTQVVGRIVGLLSRAS